MLYVPPAFRIEDRETVFDHIERSGLTMLTTVGRSGPIISHLPLLLDRGEGPDGDVRLIGHLAKANPQIKETDPDMHAVAVFPGPEAYISPSWYPSKAQTARVVPTWNYAVVHAEGVIRFIHDESWLRAQVERLTDREESALDKPWAVSDAPAPYLEGQLKGIVGVELTVEAFYGKYKLSQNKTEADRQGVIDGLLARDREHERPLRALMASSGEKS